MRGDAISLQGEFDIRSPGRLEDIARAISDATRTIELDPKSVNAYLNRGSAYTYRGDVERAIADYTRILEIDAKHVFAYVDRSNAYLKGRDYDRAIADATKAIRMDSSCEQAY